MARNMPTVALAIDAAFTISLGIAIASSLSADPKPSNGFKFNKYKLARYRSKYNNKRRSWRTLEGPVDMAIDKWIGDKYTIL